MSHDTVLDELNEPIKEANWMNIGKLFKLAGVGLIGAGLVFAGYWGGEYLTNQQYDYVSYVDAATVDIAMDMQAICDQRKVCNKSEIIAKFQRNASESLMLDMVEDIGGGK